MLWIEAVCIDQDSPPEGSKEVASMASTYKMDSHVIVWLGEESPISSLAVQTMRDISKDIEVAHR